LNELDVLKEQQKDFVKLEELKVKRLKRIELLKRVKRIELIEELIEELLEELTENKSFGSCFAEPFFTSYKRYIIWFLLC
jgi:hypothetical protein